MDSAADLLAISANIGVTILAPFTITLNGQSVTFSAFVPQFGSTSGMVVDPDWSVIQPHTHSLKAAGFGYSCMSFETLTVEGLWDVLKDWGWKGTIEKKARLGNIA